MSAKTPRPLQRCLAWLTAVAVLASQLVPPPRAQAASLGSASASAGSVSPPAIAAIQSFQPDPFTGRATTSIPIAVPPGRKGMQPVLALAYSSSSRNGWAGVGWGLDLGYIERSTKAGVPHYDATDGYAFMLQGVNSELVQIPDGTYRAKDEGLFLRFDFRGVSGWEVRDKSGTRYVFGQTVASQIQNGGRIFRWCLDKIVETNGNSLTITYTSDAGQLYPAQIRYTGHELSSAAPLNEVDFILEDRPDAEMSYRSGFAITTAKRLAHIETYATLSGVKSLARRYDLAYTVSPLTSRSLLASVTQVGADGITALPPTTFTYNQTPPTYLHCHNCVPAISSGNGSWQLQYQVAHLFPSTNGGNDQRLWTGGSWEPGVKNWGAEVCRRRLFRKTCTTIPQSAAIPPVSWGSPQLQTAGSSGGVAWSTDAVGNLSVSGPIDTHVLAMTWLYTSVAKTVSVPVSTSGHADVFYAAPGSATWSVASGNAVPLSPGWTVVAVTAYDEMGGFSLSMSANLTSQVSAMNHNQFSVMGLSADFNGDGFADLGHLDPATNHWHVVLNSPNGFGQEQTWLSATLPSSTVTMVGDVDADGRADLILWNASTGLWQVARSTGTSFAAPVTWHSGFGAGETPFMGDFDGDQLLDVGTFSGGRWQIARSTGGGFAAPATWLSGFGAGAVPLTGDFNGDGLTDAAANANGTISVALATGSGFIVQPSPWIIGFNAGAAATAADINGDGLTDLLSYMTSAGVPVVANSTGTGFGATRQSMTDHPFQLRGLDDVFQVGDFSGKGMAGFGVFNPLSGAAEIASAMGTPPDLLTNVANGLGGVSTITYRPSTDFDNTGGDGVPDMGFVLPVVTQADVSGGMGHTVTSRYAYRGGLYDAATREFRGFAGAIATDAGGTFTETRFSQDLHTKGRPLSIEVRDSAGQLYTKTANTWSCADPSPGVHVVRLDQTDSVVYDGDATSRQVRARMAYDAYGNVTRVDDDGEVSVIGDERAMVTTFAYNTTDWILAKPSLTQTLDATGAVVVQHRFSYDGATTPAAAPIMGNLTKEEEWLNLPSPAWLPTTMTYDGYGNVASVTDALGRTTTSVYDASGTYLTRITNALGHHRDLAYDARFGQVISSTDQNGAVVMTEYDALGRVVKAIGPNDTSVLPTIEYQYDLSAVPAKTATLTRIQSGQTPVLTAYAFSDGLGRTIQTRAPAEDPTKQVVSGAVELDAKGQAIKQWVPYLDATSPSYVAPPSSGLAPPAQYAYDPIGRVIQTTEPNGSVTLVDYNDGETTTTLANGGQTQKRVDAYGRLIRVDEVESETVQHTTSYAYDARGNLVQVTDAVGHVTRIAYDSLGRKLSMDDPDMGHWTYAYDAVDNLASQTDARGVTTQFTYDALNRLAQKSYLDTPLTSHLSPVTYSYDDPTIPNAIGKLTGVADGSGTSRFVYDALGRLSREQKVVGGTTYTIQRAYDLLGRLTSLTYPTSDVASYTYNTQGGIETVNLQSPVSGLMSLVSDMAYNAAGQLTKIVHGDGVVTNYSYNPQTLRLDGLLARSPTGSTLQDVSYAYDPVGNITALTDRVHTATQTFTYDALSRLTRAVGSYGDARYAYDALGNLTSKEGRPMTYGLPDGTKPHAVTSVQRAAFSVQMTYDANGNMTSKTSPEALTDATYTYDAENRLTEVRAPQEETVRVTFQPGWNFFSLPVIPTEGSIGALFPAFPQDFEQLARWEPTSGRFQHYVGNAKFDQVTTLSYGEGYEVYCKRATPVTIAFTGKLPSKPLNKNLPPTWHLLPAGVVDGPKPVLSLTAGLDADAVLAYDPTTGTLLTPTQLDVARAYFVHLRTASTFSPSLPRDPTTRFLYDGDGGRVQSVTAKGTTTFLGESLEVAPDGTTTTYVFAGSQRIAALAHPPGSPLASRKPAGTRAYAGLLRWLIPDAEAAGPAPILRFYHPDHLGSTNLVTDAQGQVVEVLAYTPFGSAAPASSPQPATPSAFTFTGQRHDMTTGLAFYHARYYDPDLGRFTQPDPFVQDPADPQTLNRYTYVRNNPVNLVDPSGLKWSWSKFFGIVAIAALVIVTAGVAAPYIAGAAGVVGGAIEAGVGAAAAAAAAALPYAAVTALASGTAFAFTPGNSSPGFATAVGVATAVGGSVIGAGELAGVGMLAYAGRNLAMSAAVGGILGTPVVEAAAANLTGYLEEIGMPQWVARLAVGAMAATVVNAFVSKGFTAAQSLTAGDAFEGALRYRTFRKGDSLYRSPWTPDETPNNPGRWFGTRRTTTVAGTESQYNARKWGNPLQVMRKYRVKEDVTLPYGKVAGGKGYQTTFPDSINPEDYLEFTGEEWGLR